MSVTITGLSEAVAKLDALGRGVRRNALEAAALEGVEPILADARRRVPVETGRLRSSLKKQIWKSSDTRADAEVVSDPDVAFYGHMVEFGTRHSSGDPFLRPAFDANRGAAEDRVRDSLQSAVERAVR